MSEVSRYGIAVDHTANCDCRIVRKEGGTLVDAGAYDALNVENARLREALWAYGRHERKCAIKMADRGGECTCGLDAALSPQEQVK